MIGVNCLQDLKQKLILAGYEIWRSQGWFFDTAHGRWTMAHGDIYCNSDLIKQLEEAPPPVKKKKPLRVAKKIAANKSLDLNEETL